MAIVLAAVFLHPLVQFIVFWGAKSSSVRFSPSLAAFEFLLLQTLASCLLVFPCEENIDCI
jgi:hypothetical protein